MAYFYVSFLWLLSVFSLCFTAICTLGGGTLLLISLPLRVLCTLWICETVFWGQFWKCPSTSSIPPSLFCSSNNSLDCFTPSCRFHTPCSFYSFFFLFVCMFGYFSLICLQVLLFFLCRVRCVSKSTESFISDIIIFYFQHFHWPLSLEFPSAGF